MNPWGIFMYVLGWVVVVLLSLMVLTAIFAVFIGTARAVRTWFPGKEPIAPVPTALKDDYMAEATSLGIKLYGSSPNPSLEAFRAGARWGWGFFSRP